MKEKSYRGGKAAGLEVNAAQQQVDKIDKKLFPFFKGASSRSTTHFFRSLIEVFSDDRNN